MKIRVEEYIRPDGSIPYKEWFDSLDAHAAAKVATAKIRMELGNTSNVKWFSGIGEYVIDRALVLLVEYKARKAPPASDSNRAKKRKR
jgi:hypothetical protein